MDKQLIDKKLKMYLTKNVNTLNDVVDKTNAIVLEQELGNTAGLYMYIEKNRLILINSNLSDSKKKIVLAHELSHAILHTKSNCAFNLSNAVSKAETEANYCANVILETLNIFKDREFTIHKEELTSKDKGFMDAHYFRILEYYVGGC